MSREIVRLGFKAGGRDAFLAKLKTLLNGKAWVSQIKVG